MAIEIASLEIPLTVTGQSAVASALRQTEQAGVRAAQAITDSQAKVQKGAALTAVELKSVTQGLVALGYSAQQARTAVSHVLANGTLANQSAVLKAALTALQGPLTATTAGLQAEAAALTATTRAASGASAALSGLSKRGLSMATSATTALAVSAAGVPGPLGRIGQALLLLGGVASGPLLIVTAGVAALALAWNKFGRVSDEAKAAVERMNAALHKQSQVLLDIAEAEKELAKQRGLQRFFAFFAEGGTSGILGGLAQKFGAVADEIERTARAFTALSAHGAADDWLARFNQRNPMPGPAPAAPSAAPISIPLTAPQLALDHRSLAQRIDDMVNWVRVTRELREEMDGLAVSLEDVGNAAVGSGPAVEEFKIDLEALAVSLNSIVTGAIMGIAAGIGAALAGEGNIGDVLLGAIGTAFQQFGEALVVGAGLIQIALEGLGELNPLAAVAAGLALIAVGSMLSTKARQSFGGATAAGYGGGQAAPFGDTTVTRTAGASGTPGASGTTARASALRAATPVQQFFTIIGPNDPTVQRQIALATAGAQRRGY